MSEFDDFEEGDDGVVGDFVGVKDRYLEFTRSLWGRRECINYQLCFM